MKFTKEQATAVEKQWVSRAKSQGWKPSSKKYRDLEVEFFCGAMAAILAITEDTAQWPPLWVINPMSGRPIVEAKHE